jgi:hypothetical protein
MSLYNAVFGVNSMAGLLLQILGIHARDIPRFRDCYLDTTAREKPLIVIYTRTGGGNRAYFDKPGPSIADEYPGPYNEDLRKLPGFIHDEDDEFDSTYALFYFNVPYEDQGLPQALVSIQDQLGIDSRKPAERFKQLIADLEAKKDTPDTQRGKEIGLQLVEQIAKMMKEE